LEHHIARSQSVPGRAGLPTEEAVADGRPHLAEGRTAAGDLKADLPQGFPAGQLHADCQPPERMILLNLLLLLNETAIDGFGSIQLVERDAVMLIA
jgi:hypothetical protein